MAKKKPIVLAVPQPCSEEWNKMTPTEKGKHCANCNKVITDFTVFSDKELIDFISNAKGTVCGRINSYQLNRPLVDYNSSPSFWQRLFWGSALASTLAACHNDQTQHQQTTVGEPMIMHDGTQKQKSADSNFIQGTIAADDKLLASVKVIIPGANLSTYTDKQGNYKLAVPDSLIGRKVKIAYIDKMGKFMEEDFKIDKLPFTANIETKTVTAESLPLTGILVCPPPKPDTINRDTNLIGVLAQIMPKFDGDIQQYLAKNIIYPKDLVESNVQGTAYVTFVIEKNGSISGTKILRGVHPELDSIAVNVVRHMPKWKPAEQSGKKVRIMMTLPIHFMINDKKE